MLKHLCNRRDSLYNASLGIEFFISQMLLEQSPQNNNNNNNNNKKKIRLCVLCLQADLALYYPLFKASTIELGTLRDKLFKVDTLYKAAFHLLRFFQ